MSRPEWLPTTHVEVGVHVYETTRFATRLYPEQDRATVRIDGSDAHVTVFGHHGDLVRLRDVLAEVVTQLETARSTTSTTAA
ncbi:hypothetical protein [Pseudonocardia oroxyli]|uniref:Uncharacterized protein n=1 Tax=Pseudonocardia oroxyli TaxID=366584 RepID=A0A1G7QVM1_PSEOR|nr:hypothetical protein [Pseudonocardia oroxyli]SDG02504.1 hypothetical protein SAMN05216377_108197 [Pseudonocardia oroxyli]